MACFDGSVNGWNEIGVIVVSRDEEVEGTVEETAASEISWDTRGCGMTIERDQLGKSLPTITEY